MNRELKFRVWDKNENEWAHSNANVKPSHDGTWTISVEERLVVMQYTGLKDKNGKEIYEGDIVTYKDLSGFSCEYEDWHTQGEQILKPRVVEFKDGQFWPREYANIVDDGFYSWRIFDFEVVGNIYEYPELLK